MSASAGTLQLQVRASKAHASDSPNTAKETPDGALLEDPKEGADASTSRHGPKSDQARKDNGRGGAVRAAGKKRQFVRRLMKPFRKALYFFYIWPRKHEQDCAEFVCHYPF